jgi:LemA protein
MANELDEKTGPTREEGRDIHVIDKVLAPQTGWGSILFEVVLWALFVIPGLVFLFMKIEARNHFQRLQQKIQANASQIDNYLEQRVQILNNVVGIVNKAIDLDKDVMKTVAALRSKGSLTEDTRGPVSDSIDTVMRQINIAVEAYPDLKAHKSLADAMQQNSYLQREITAAREVYNDTILQWNQDLFAWPTKMIVASSAKLTTRIPFIASKETKEKARSTFF